MKCPMCNEVDLVMADRQGVEIDYCPKCRGVWLDRGELDKIIERSAVVEASGRGGADRSARVPSTIHDDDHHGRGYLGASTPDHGRRKSWLGELFD